MGKKQENNGFICIGCNASILPLKNGSFRNHCPFCLLSLHVDNNPGDRKSSCHGPMIACRLIHNSKKGWQIVHKCQTCKQEKVNKIAEGTPQPDDWDAIIKLLASKN